MCVCVCERERERERERVSERERERKREFVLNVRIMTHYISKRAYERAQLNKNKE